jgi:exodeoxyribonuclease-3
VRETKNKPVILAGDLNVARGEMDIYDTKGKEKVAGYTPQERTSFENFLKQGWIDTFREKYPNTVKYSFWSAR